VNDELERVELKIAYLERANNELSDVVYRQQQELAALAERVAMLATRLDTIKAGEGTAYSLEEERPPHY
jgi:SlyX protein